MVAVVTIDSLNSEGTTAMEILGQALGWCGCFCCGFTCLRIGIGYQAYSVGCLSCFRVCMIWLWCILLVAVCCQHFHIFGHAL